MIEAELGRSTKRTIRGISLSANLFLLSGASGKMHGAVFCRAMRLFQPRRAVISSCMSSGMSVSNSITSPVRGCSKASR